MIAEMPGAALKSAACCLMAEKRCAYRHNSSVCRSPECMDGLLFRSRHCKPATTRCEQRWPLQVLSFPEPAGLPHILFVIACCRTPSRIAVATMDKPFGHGGGDVVFVGQSVILSDQEPDGRISPRCQVRDGTAIGSVVVHAIVKRLWLVLSK